MYVPGRLEPGIISPVFASKVKFGEELNTPPVKVPIPFKLTNCGVNCETQNGVS